MACVHINYYPKIKDLIHPNINENINHYKKGCYYILPVYHGCGLRNRNGLNKRVDYKRGYQCIFATNKPYWRRTKNKYKFKKVYNTRYQSDYNIRCLSLVKGLYYYNHRTKKYMHEDSQSKIFYITKKGTLLNDVITAKSVKYANDFILLKLNLKKKVFGRLTKTSDIGM